MKINTRATRIVLGGIAVAATATLTVNGTAHAADFYGSAAANHINGSNYADQIYAYQGSDTVYSKGGNDFVDAGKGHDYVQLGLGHDSAKGGPGNDEIGPNNGADSIWAGAGNDTVSIWNDGYGDYIDCGTGYDTVYYDQYSWDYDDTFYNCEEFIPVEVY